MIVRRHGFGVARGAGAGGVGPISFTPAPSGSGYQYATYNFANGSVGTNCNDMDMGGGNIQPMCQSVTSPPVDTPPVAGGSLLFENLTSPGNLSNFNIGDKWQITITQASAGQPVTVTGGLNGTSATNQMGTTDAAGTFRLAGQFTADQVGLWQESWAVGGSPSGFVAFSVLPAAVITKSPPAPVPPSGVVTPPVVTPPATTGTFDVGAFLTGSAFMGIPNWMLLAAAAGAIVLFGSKR